MKNFIVKTIVFGLPIFVFLLVPFFFLYVSGENYQSVDDAVKKNNNYLIGYAYNEGNYKYLKRKELKYRETLSIIALGSSRVLQFRRRMFTKPFYNAGYTISSIADFVPAIKNNILKKKPEILLIALDQWMFNENWDDLDNYNSYTGNWKKNYSINASVPTLINVWKDVFAQKYGVETLYNNEDEYEIGLNAVVNNRGFRKDGSIYYGDQIDKLLKKDSTAIDFNYLDTYSRIDKGVDRFEYANHVNKKALIALNDLLLFCKKNDIYVVAIIPPFADDVNLKMKQSQNYAYMDSIFPKSKKIFKKYNFELWDMSNLSKYDSNDNETIDGFHGSEVSYMKMLIYMVENNSKLKNYTDKEKLNNDLINKVNDYSVYKNQFSE